MDALQFRRLIEQKGKVEAVRRFAKCGNEAEADAYIKIYINRLLQSGKYGAAGVLLWGENVFDHRPRTVRRIWKAINSSAKVMLQGGGSQGKSYTGIAWLLLDWWRDPEYTSVKIVSTTAGHAKANTFATLQMLHKQAIVEMPGTVHSEHIGLTPEDKRACISIVKIPTGDDGKGRLQGFHPIPRPTPHPVLGKVSRVRAFLDEAEEIPFGVWEGVANMTASLDGVDSVKVLCAYNPKDIAKKVAQLAAPAQGHEWVARENVEEWRAKEGGWNVIRLDPKNTENVIERRVVFPALQTYEGFRDYETKNGGNSPEYWTFGRGLYPPDGVSNNIIASSIFSAARGEFVFISSTIRVAGVDIAVEGRDNAVMTVGRWGMASEFVSSEGVRRKFKNPRMVLQIDQQIELKKGTTRIVANDIREKCRALKINPAYICLDRTGNGGVVHDYLCEVWDDSVQGVDFSKPATEIKILAEDLETPEEQYDGVVTEVWYALARWLEFGYIAISTGVRIDPLQQECLGRKYNLAEGKKTRVEKKDIYKGRLGHSPDFGDSLTICVHSVRMATGEKQTMQDKPKDERPLEHAEHGVVDRVDWFDDTGV